MVQAAVTGILTAVVLVGIQYFQNQFFAPNGSARWMIFVGIALAALAAALLRRWILPSRTQADGQAVAFPSYDGTADLMAQIHQPSTPDSARNWSARGTVSGLLAIFSGAAGPEGAAMEWAYAATLRTRPRSARWFELRRRTDAAVVLSAGVAAAFGAPFAAVMMPIELGIGGRALSSVISAVAALLAGRYFQGFFGLKQLDVSGSLLGTGLLGLLGLREWIALLIVGALAGFVGAALLYSVQWWKKGFRKQFEKRSWLAPVLGCALLAAIGLADWDVLRPSAQIFQDLLVARRAPASAFPLLLGKFISLGVVLSSIGTLGLLWPVFIIGGLFGFSLDHLFFGTLPGFGPVLAFTAGSALFGSALGAPLTGALLAYEMTGRAELLFPCILAALIARETRYRLGARVLHEQDLRARGIELIEGRSASLLAAIPVQEAMATDFETVGEHEIVSELGDKLSRSRYPFLPVLQEDGSYKGLLTIDMIRDNLENSSSRKAGATSNSSLAHLLEVKDLLYRSGFKTPILKPTDALSVTTGMFEDLPCVPVLSEEGKIIGLLFAHGVRQAYEKESARRSFSPENVH